MKKVLATVGIMIFLFGAAAGAFAAQDVVRIVIVRRSPSRDRSLPLIRSYR